MDSNHESKLAGKIDVLEDKLNKMMNSYKSGTLMSSGPFLPSMMNSDDLPPWMKKDRRSNANRSGPEDLRKASRKSR